jgi:hypothetical protein
MRHETGEEMEMKEFPKGSKMVPRCRLTVAAIPSIAASRRL